MQVRLRKLQQKVINLQHKSRTLEHRAAQRTQKSAELKVKVDRFLELSRLEEQEASSFRQRADRSSSPRKERSPPASAARRPEPARPPGPA